MSRDYKQPFETIAQIREALATDLVNREEYLKRTFQQFSTEAVNIAEELEARIKRTGGVPVTLQGKSTNQG